MRLTILMTLLVLILVGCSKEEHLEPYPDPVSETPAQLTEEAILAEAEARVSAAEQAIAQEAVEKVGGKTVLLPADSEDGLADAIAEAGDGGRVIVASGLHHESATVMIDRRVRIEGQPGAVLIVDVGGPGQTFDPALYVRDADRVRITGLEIRPATIPGNTGILVRNDGSYWINDNTLIGFQWGMWLAGGDHSRILNNYVEGYGEQDSFWGITLMSGKRAIVFGNEVTNYRAAIFLSDHRGLAYRNTTYGNWNGLFLCAAQGTFFPDGTAAHAPASATNWIITQNHSADNWLHGYMVRDGAVENFLVSNRTADNPWLDYRLRGNIYSPDGSLQEPGSARNRVILLGAYRDDTVLDCGEDNVVFGGTLVTDGPCP